MSALALDHDVSTCSLAGKRSYATRQDAMKALFNARTARLNGNQRRREQRFYCCEQCGSWHLTSQAAESCLRTDDVRQSAAVIELATRNHRSHV